ncbi:hypothetical protein CHLNCDRAFT_141164 [Chlorella variabilis]|uniref:Nuclear pore complex protein n=1 Tax=Chlorella variabilis TaxID=554065 RepID=E1ZS80_CHLVA|nr:hypothetical protein CHLNCDRAFT_141164 [Chlorella variabilis]EFN51202.1 hypothetical protein CHLNCDRAFT_141164 [Chlorella variabilis]|eukprot:XP_005843304.1 hypothetical protein CHLNCDRAFT_141164 [Chlorella variabilis]
MQGGLAYSNPYFGAEGLSPSPSQAGEFNQAFSPAPGGAPPSSALGFRRLGALPQSQLGRLRAQEPSPGGSDEAMVDGKGEGGEGADQQPPAASLAGASPGTVAGGSGGSRERPEEDEFAGVLGAVMRDDEDAAEAVRLYAAICRQRAAALRELASSQLQRAARYMSLKEQAEELEGEAATWQLLWFLHGVPQRDFPGGSGGGFVDGAGFTKTSRQRASDLLFADAELNRRAGWQAQRRGVKAHPGLALACLRSPPAQVWPHLALVTELDPDAPTRQHKAVQADDGKDEERVMARVFALMRAGRMGQARQLCEAVGQPWRGASLGGGGGHGPLPLGVAAKEAEGMDPGGEQAADLAAEVEGGEGTLRALWRWACFQAAERAGASAEASGGGLHEAAVYAALSCHLARLLPVCASWEDCCWAYLRCWLDAAVVNIDAPPAASATLCRHVCYPRLALKCAALREALAFMGHTGGEGDELVVMVASPEMSPLFSQAELAELLQFERAATVLQLRNREQQQQQQQQGGERAGGESTPAGVQAAPDA